MSVLFTVGHSTHPIEVFVGLLKQHGITALADVRSHPYSRHFPQYSQEALKAALAREQIAYVFLGKELGARSENPACYRQGKVQYELLAKEPQFAVGLERLRAGIERFRITLMCAEKDPLDCHRAVLVARRVFESGTPVEHIHADGHLEKHAEMEARMLDLLKMSDADMFRSREEILVDAYRIRGEQIAYEDEAMLKEESGDRRPG
ncbi:DUF488 domain-containing protein [Thermithiobacillus plumbiphilus]|uniref:DUF488 domain-containing protein n=1 Tax=Thermithiobacillus plumbiphilus TaxID=1729899 RepID=A0ABU9D6P4_9PROT